MLIGAVIVAFVYLWGRRAPAEPKGTAEVARRAPELGDVDDTPPLAPTRTTRSAHEPSLGPQSAQAPVAAPEPEPGPELEPEPESATSEPTAADKVVILHLVSGDDKELDAAEVVAALRAEGLRFGHYDIFHRFSDEGNPGPNSQPHFSVANMLKPGSFQLDKLKETTIKGISLFLQIPGPPDPLAAFADMLATGRRLAVTVSGQLVDGQGCTVTRQSASHMREDIINHLHSAKIASEQEAQSDA